MLLGGLDCILLIRGWYYGSHHGCRSFRALEFSPLGWGWMRVEVKAHGILSNASSKYPLGHGFRLTTNWLGQFWAVNFWPHKNNFCSKAITRSHISTPFHYPILEPGDDAKQSLFYACKARPKLDSFGVHLGLQMGLTMVMYRPCGLPRLQDWGCCLVVTWLER